MIRQEPTSSYPTITAFLNTLAREPWTAQAACIGIDPDLWFPEKGGPTRKARKICETCPVQTACYNYALQHPETQHGVWGGKGARQIRKARGQAGAA